MGEEIFVKLRDCFTGGYTLPQYCIDNGIKKPLFVSEKKFELFVWEVYVQFRYDKRLSAQFCFHDGDDTTTKHFPAHSGIIYELKVQKFSAMNFDDFDKIIFLTTENPKELGKNFVRLADLERFFIRRTYAEIPLLNFMQRHPKVKLILTKFPYVGRYKDGAEFAKQLKTYKEMQEILRADKSGHVKTPLDKLGYTNEEFLILMGSSKLITNRDGSTTMSDNENPLIKIKNGKRMTACQPEKFLNKIYFVGSCHDFGVHAPFDKTIESYLQKLFNEHNLPYRVENESQHYWNRYQDIFYNLNKLTPAPGDVIFCWIANMVSDKFPYLDLTDALDPPHDYKECFCTAGHVNELGYKFVAEKYFKFLTENNFFRDVDINPPPPQSTTAPLRYTAAIRDERLKKFFQPRT